MLENNDNLKIEIEILKQEIKEKEQLLSSLIQQLGEEMPTEEN